MCDYMQRFYLDSRIAEEVNARLREGLRLGAYRDASDEPAFAETVSQDTIAVSGDRHLRLRHSVAALPEREDPMVAESGRYPQEAAAEGHGFGKVERLAGNVGLVDIRRFFPLSMSRHAAVAAMHLIADSDALIVDLRQSLGGEPEMVAFICSYLFDEPTHLNDLYFPADDRTIEWWTDRTVPGPTYGGTKPVWVLVSAATISAAEEFAYDLQQLQRATLVGEITAGAANFDYRYRVTEHLMFSVPSGYPINPHSGKGWEGTGVRPDIEVGANGLRRCEVLGLRLTDLDAPRRQVFIVEGKGGHQRRIPISARFFITVGDYLRIERPDQATTDRVFVVLKGQRRGQPLSDEGLKQIFVSARERAGLRRITCHQLRHTCFTRLREAGMELEALQAQAGHRSIETTRLYVHLANEWLAAEYHQAIAIIDADLFLAAGEGVGE